MTAIETTENSELAAAQTGSGYQVRDRRLHRSALVAAAGLGNTVIFLIARAAGTDFTITDPGAAAKAHTFVAPEIGIISVIFALAGWATFAALERWTARPRLVWGILATVVELLSMVAIGIEHATISTRIMLAVIHLGVAVALLPMLRRPRSS